MAVTDLAVPQFSAVIALRFAARCVDLLILILVVMALDRTLNNSAPAVVFVVGYLWLGDSYGGTLGKRLFGLRLECACEGGHIGLFRASVRYIVFVLLLGPSLWLGWFGICPSLWGRNGQFIHDLAVESITVRGNRTTQPRPGTRMT